MSLFGRRAQRPGERGGAPVDSGRWVVIDTEASGLDARRDRLLAIAGVALRLQRGAPRIALGDSFETLLRQPDAAPDKDNILVHGIGVGAQRGGTEPRAALEAFADWVGASPLIGFHVSFDRALIDRHCEAVLGRRLPNRWLDIEQVGTVLLPKLKKLTLDQWLAHAGVACVQRHQAAADALASAELLLALWPAARAQMKEPSFEALSELAAHRKWIA